MSQCIEHKISALQVRISEENKLNATTQQFITAKIPDCVLKLGSKTHSPLRQSNLQLQNHAAPVSSPVVSNPNGLLSHKLYHYLNQGHTFIDIFLRATH